MIPACPRVHISKVKNWPLKYIEKLEQNQKLPSCCRHPENHDVEAFKSVESEPGPDIFISHCTCGRRHIYFCVGSGVRPFWEIR